jgi:peptide deformylase
MILPVVAYGSPILRKIAEPITSDYQGLNELITNMFETMEKADGVGLAAPQINRSIRLFVIDASPLAEKEEDLKNFRQAFINARILDYSEEEGFYNEGCLSIPGLHEDVKRPISILLQWVDENFVIHETHFSGIKARIIQHEYDHLEGIMFSDLLSPLKKRLIKGKLTDIIRGKSDTEYKMILPTTK